MQNERMARVTRNCIAAGAVTALVTSITIYYFNKETFSLGELVLTGAVIGAVTGTASLLISKILSHSNHM